MTDDARDYSLVVFGATGFTGQYVAEEVARIADEENITWAIAGRNSEKLNAIIENVGKVTGILLFCHVKKIFFSVAWLLNSSR